MKHFPTKGDIRRAKVIRKWMKILIPVLIVLAAVWVPIQALRIQKATAAYNAAVAEYNRCSARYDQLTALTCVDNIDGMPLSFGTLSSESETLGDSFRVVFSRNGRLKILRDTATIRMLIEEMDGAAAIARQITAPDQEWVLRRLETVAAIRDMQAVTADHDPDGLLNQTGGYGACIYFNVEGIDPDTVSGADIVAKGTDAGGAVEVYRTVEEAQARCDYLAQFDGTLLYSGSYAIVGTMVIRTSYMLSDYDQFELTSQITEALTSRT